MARTKGPSPIDRYVGSRVRMRRLMVGISQEKLGDELGLTFQQVQKYEKGVNRIGASRLYRMSEILQCTVSFFFEGMPGTDGAPRMDPASSAQVTEFLASPAGIELTMAFQRIKAPDMRRSIVTLVKEIADAKWA